MYDIRLRLLIVKYFLKALKDGKKDLYEIYEYLKTLVEDKAKMLNIQQSLSLQPEAEKLK